MTFPVDPAERQPKGDHNRRLSLGLEPEQFAAAANVSVDELREYERTGPDHGFDVVVAERVGEALDRLEKVIPNSEAPGVELSLHGRSRDEVLADDAAEQLIRDAAYRLWEADGRPEGRDQEYWYRATEARRPASPELMVVPDPDTIERAFETSRKIGLQREFKKSPDDSVSGGFNQKSQVNESASGTVPPIPTTRTPT